ncbi:MAG: hypothetical protein O3C21_08420 [Verrucomicrobia bacterium]|nr:hypothetical protein [Verrucomicrobiota bacterium]
MMPARKSPHSTAARLTTLLSVATAFATTAPAQEDEKVYPEGYSDTPKLPNSQWKVHDIDRPRPVVVTPGKTASDAPSDATVLFAGSDLSAWHGENETEDAEGKKQRTADKDAPARWKVEDGKLESPAAVTILHNGLLVQNHFELLGATTHREVATYSPHPDKAPIRLQDHNDKQPVRYRNIWVRPL